MQEFIRSVVVEVEVRDKRVRVKFDKNVSEKVTKWVFRTG